MAQAIRVQVIGQAYDDVVLSMIVRENFDHYRMTHDIIVNAITRATSCTSDNSEYISTAIYDARMKGKIHIVVEGTNGIEYQVHMCTGEETILHQM